MNNYDDRVDVKVFGKNVKQNIGDMRSKFFFFWLNAYNGKISKS